MRTRLVSGDNYIADAIEIDNHGRSTLRDWALTVSQKSCVMPASNAVDFYNLKNASWQLAMAWLLVNLSSFSSRPNSPS